MHLGGYNQGIVIIMKSKFCPVSDNKTGEIYQADFLPDFLRRYAIIYKVFQRRQKAALQTT